MAKLQDVKIIEASGGKVTEIERDGTTYKLVQDTAPKDGDILRSSGVHDAEEGSFYTARKRGGPMGVSVIYDDVGDMRSNLDGFDVFRAPEPALKVGDYAKFIRTDEGTGGKGTEGDIVELIGVGHAFDFKFKRMSDGEISYTSAGKLTKASEEEVAQVEERVKPPVKAGDKIRITNAETTFGEYENGDILTVKHAGSGLSTHVYAEGIEVYINSEEFEGLSDDEARQAKLAEVFAQFGRKPGELKKGDLVRFTPGEGRLYHGLKEYPGIVAEVKTAFDDGSAYLLTPSFVTGEGYGTHTLAEEIELVTPVESRVDTYA